MEKLDQKYITFRGTKFYKVKVINKLLSIKGMKFSDCIKFTNDRKR